MFTQRTNSTTQPVVGMSEMASEAKTTIPSASSAGKRRRILRRSKNLAVVAVKKASPSFFGRAQNNPSLRRAYFLFLCTLLPFVAIYTYVKTVYFTEKSEQRRPEVDKVPDSDDTSASASQDSSEHATSSTSSSDNDVDDKQALEMDTGRSTVEDDSLFEMQRRSLKKRAAAVPTRKEEFTMATPKTGFWKSLCDTNQVLKVILVEDSSF